MIDYCLALLLVGSLLVLLVWLQSDADHDGYAARRRRLLADYRRRTRHMRSRR